MPDILLLQLSAVVVVLLLLIDADMKVFAGTRIPAGSLLLVVPYTLVVEAGYHNLQIQL